MKKIGLLLLLLCLPATAQAQFSSDFRTAGTLTASCSNATTTCNGTPGSSVEATATGFGVATVTVGGTYAGVTIFFEFTDDGINWFQNTCTRTDQAIQEGSETLPSNTTRAWDCGIAGSIRMRVRSSAYTSGTANIGITTTAASIEPAPTIQISQNGTVGSNPCVNPHTNPVSSSTTTSGTTATQIVALVAAQKIYVCSMTVIGQSGTTPTFSLVTGTGSNCATGQTVLVQAFATPANTLFQFANPVAITPAGQAVCYLQTGTTPVTVAQLVTIQQ